MFLTNLYNTILFEPVFNLLMFLYQLMPAQDMGLAVILLTMIVKALLLPIDMKALRSQKALQEMQPKIDEIQKKYKDDKEEQAKQTMLIFQESKINPFFGIWALFIQIPILIAIYQVLTQLSAAVKNGQSIAIAKFYPFVHQPEVINYLFLGIIDLSKPALWMAIIVGILQFIQIKMTMGKTPKTKDSQSVMQQSMAYFSPIFLAIVLTALPAVIGVYFLATSIWTIAQQQIIQKKKESHDGQ